MARDKEVIKQDILDELRWDASVDSKHVSIELSDGKVILSGTVSSNYSRLNAEHDVLSVPDVDEVDNRLTVKYPGWGNVPSDKEIEENIGLSLSWEPGINPKHIKSRADDGVVTLEGTVSNVWLKARAEKRVWDIPGVTNVINDITVTPMDEFTDEEIGAKISRALSRDNRTDINAIDVVVANRIVVLSGTVESRDALKRAEEIARRTEGVKEIKNNLIIK